MINCCCVDTPAAWTPPEGVVCVCGKAETCAYSIQCACTVPTAVDFKETIVRDVLIADMDIFREILGTDKILEHTVNDVITLVEGKEMARNALLSPTAGISSFK